MWGAIKKLRHTLHKYPELSGKEEQTSQRMILFLSKHTYPTKIIRNIGGHGFLATYNTRKPGPTIMLRAELDALPLSETTNLSYRSTIFEAGHQSGHDGHMAILAALGVMLKKNPIPNGRVIFLFQASKENGKGAWQTIQDKRFYKYKPDYIFSLHNIPGSPAGTLILKKNAFTTASTGVSIRVYSKLKHSPESDIATTPIFALADLTNAFKNYAIPNYNSDNIKSVIPVYSRVGNKSFTALPASGELLLSIRTNNTTSFAELKEEILKHTNTICTKYDLEADISWKEEFPSVINHDKTNQMLLETAKNMGINYQFEQQPFKWSEDFGHFTNEFCGSMFGLGAGITKPALHNSEYDFPDDIIQTGAELYLNLIHNIIKEYNKCDELISSDSHI